MLRSAIALLLALAGVSSASAQSYPARAVKVIVPFAVGGPADIYGRFIAAKLQDALGQPFVVEDRPGGGSIVGTDAAAKSAPDGYTLLVMSNTHTVNETLVPKKPFDLMKDFAPITGLNFSDLIMMFDAIPTMNANARAGKVRTLGTTGAKRSPVTPDVPTVDEAGVKGYEATIWLGLMAPAGTPRPILEKLNGEINKILASAEVKETWGKQGAQPMGMSIDAFDRFLRADVAKWEKIVKSSGAKAD